MTGKGYGNSGAGGASGTKQRGGLSSDASSGTGEHGSYRNACSLFWLINHGVPVHRSKAHVRWISHLLMAAEPQIRSKAPTGFVQRKRLQHPVT